MAPFGLECPFLGVIVNSNLLFEAFGLLKFRSFILSQHILLTLYLFQQRLNRILQSNKNDEILFEDRENEEQNPTKAAITQLGYNSVAFIFRYNYEALAKLMEDVMSLQVIIKNLLNIF